MAKVSKSEEHKLQLFFKTFPKQAKRFGVKDGAQFKNDVDRQLDVARGRLNDTIASKSESGVNKKLDIQARSRELRNTNKTFDSIDVFKLYHDTSNLSVAEDSSKAHPVTAKWLDHYNNEYTHPDKVTNAFIKSGLNVNKAKQEAQHLKNAQQQKKATYTDRLNQANQAQDNNFGKFFNQHPNLKSYYNMTSGTEAIQHFKGCINADINDPDKLRAKADQRGIRASKQELKKLNPKKAYDIDSLEFNNNRIMPITRSDMKDAQYGVKQLYPEQSKPMDTLLKSGYKGLAQKEHHAYQIDIDKGKTLNSKQIQKYVKASLAQKPNFVQQDTLKEINKAVTKNPKLQTNAYDLKTGKFGRHVLDHDHLKQFSERDSLAKEAVNHMSDFKRYDQQSNSIKKEYKAERPEAKRHQAGLSAPIDDSLNHDFYKKHVAPHKKAYKLYESQIKTKAYNKPSRDNAINKIESQLNHVQIKHNSRAVSKSAPSQLKRTMKLNRNPRKQKTVSKMAKKVAMENKHSIHR